MSQQLHTDDLARADRTAAPTREADGDDEVMVAELAEPGDARPGAPTNTRRDTPTDSTATPTSTDVGGHWAGLADGDELRARWEAIQAGFVDEPRRAVEDADALVAQVIRQLAESFAAQRDRLEHQWSQGDQVGTEDLRVALQRYRAFFQDLLSR